MVCILHDDKRLDVDTVTGDICNATSMASLIAARVHVHEEDLGVSNAAEIAVCGMVHKRMATIRTGLARCTLKAVGAPNDMCVLGCGGEGIVFSAADVLGTVNAGGVAWKVMDRYALRANPTHEEKVLKPLVDVPTDSLVRIIHLSRGNGLVLALKRALVSRGSIESGSPPVPSPAALTRLLRECRHHGVVLRNIKLDNFVGDVFIDIGLDILPFDQAEWEYMAKQLYVCLHWPGRADLLRVRGKNFDHIPELRGLAGFRAAVDAGKHREAEIDRLRDSGYTDWDTASDPPDVTDVLITTYASRDHQRAHFYYVKNIFRKRGLLMLRRQLLQFGWELVGAEESASIGVSDGFMCTRQDFLLLECASPALGPGLQRSLNDSHAQRASPSSRITLLIRACYMEHAVIRANVEHLVRQLEGPHAFSEVVLVIDSRMENFPRQWADANKQRFDDVVAELLANGTISRVVHASEYAESDVARLNRTWLGYPSSHRHSASGTPLTATFAGLEACSSRYVLAVDSDLLICRDRRWLGDTWLDRLCETLRVDRVALAVALPSVSENTADPTPCHRFEVRGALMDMKRIKEICPFLPGDPGNFLEAPEQGWHRLLDARASTVGAHFYRGGSPRIFFLHPSNALKANAYTYMMLMDAAERGRWPAPLKLAALLTERDHIASERFSLGPQLLTRASGWLPLPRTESLVVVICGSADQPLELLRRCIESVRAQSFSDWGAVLIVEGSGRQRGVLGDYLSVMIPPDDPHFTVLHPRGPCVGLASMSLAVRELSSSSEQIIVTLDMDHALLHDDALAIIAAAHGRGADVTVGSMLCMHAEAQQPVDIDFADCRSNRRDGGGIFPHPHSFRKKLFDRLLDTDLCDNQDEPFTVACDLTYMIPIIEMASNPVKLEDQLYLYEPRYSTGYVEKREAIIEQVVGKPPYSRCRTQVAVCGDASFRRMTNDARRYAEQKAFAVGDALARAGYTVITGGMGGVMEWVCRGAKAAGGSTVGILLGNDKTEANPFVDVPIPTGLGQACNALVAQSDALVCIGGGSGTVSELMHAWSMNRPVIVFRGLGATGSYADQAVDYRRSDVVVGADNEDDVLAALRAAGLY